ncbi:MAG: HD-GYP domain-containing protein [Methylophilaceae bacterium]|nr:HD-GYP domain-containing protein [Methylophilaceae bacterium]
MLKRIQVTQLRPGMYLQEICGAWMDHPFWRSKFVIRDPEDIRLLQQSAITEVIIDTSKGLDVEPDVPAPTPQQEAEPAASSPPPAPGRKVSPPKPVSIEEEMARAAKIYAESKRAMLSMFNEARMGKAVNSEVANAMVDEISSSVARNAGALISIARLKTADEYTYMHSVAVCALMVALARQLGMSEHDTREAGMGGLLHDLGKAVMPMEVLNKPGKLTDEEFAIMKQHPEAGYKMLVEAKTAGDIPLDVCLHHHEKMDGTGYPHRLKGDQISVFAKMGAVCDVYDAITSNRPYKAGWDPAESLRRMNEWCQGHFDERIFKAFVKSIGIYPIGSLVRLRSGRLGVVTDQTEKSLLTPKVKVFYSTKSNLRIPPELVDLSLPGAQDKIVSIEDPAKWKFEDLNTLWGGTELR